MRLKLIVPILLLAGLTLPATTLAQTTDTVTVHLTVETHATDRAGLAPGELPGQTPGTATCDVTVPEGADGGDVLDAATAAGCITGWESQSFDGARFVTAIDGWKAPGYTCLAFAVGACDWWQFHVDGQPASFGIDDYGAEDGDTNRWLYRNTL